MAGRGRLEGGGLTLMGGTRGLVLAAHFCGDFDGADNNRFNYLAGALAGEGFDVELVTSGFSHTRKAKRPAEIPADIGYRVTYIPEPPYSKNVSLRRFYSHYALGRGFGKYLRARKKPAAVYCAVPSLDMAGAAARYCRDNSVKFIIDVQDLWPEAFRMVADIPATAPLFALMRRRADMIYASADAIIAVSETYAARALSANKKSAQARCVYLGTELAAFDAAAARHAAAKPADALWLAYAGTLGHSYDLSSVIEALALMEGKAPKFIVMGDGPLKGKFESLAAARGVSAAFTGRLPYGEMCGMLKACDMAVNPISRGAAQSIINKHADYAAAALPVLNTQESPEYSALVSGYGMGLNCKNSDPADMAEKLALLCESPAMRAEMSRGSRRLAEERFDRARSYKEIADAVRAVTDSAR